MHVEYNRFRSLMVGRKSNELIVAAVVAMSVAACSATGIEQSPDRSQASDSGHPSTANLAPDDFGDPQAELVASFPDAEFRRTPVELALGFVGDRVELSALRDAAYRDYSDMVSDCMALEGFTEFRLPSIEPSTPEGFSISEADQLRQFGYGATTNARAQFQALSPAPTVSPAPANPIGEYHDHLPDDQKSAFFEVLASCQEVAAAKYPNPAAEGLPIQIADEVYALRESALSSPEVVRAWIDWSNCMAERGFQLQDREAAYEYAADLMKPVFELVDEFARNRADMPDDASGQFEELLEPLSELEQELVAADLECADRHNIETVANTAIDRVEQQWLDENLDRIAVLLAE